MLLSSQPWLRRRVIRRSTCVSGHYGGWKGRGAPLLGLSGGGAPGLNFFDRPFQTLFIRVCDKFCLWSKWYLDLKTIGDPSISECGTADEAMLILGLRLKIAVLYEDYVYGHRLLLEDCDHNRSPFINWILGYFVRTMIIVIVPI